MQYYDILRYVIIFRVNLNKRKRGTAKLCAVKCKNLLFLFIIAFNDTLY